jgi:thioredoxin-related protein
MNKFVILGLFLALVLSAVTAFSVEKEDKTLIIFSAKWCHFCQIAQRDMQQNKDLSEELKSYTIIEIDFDKEKDIVEGYNIKSIPSFVKFQGGKEVGRAVGYKGADNLLKFLK